MTENRTEAVEIMVMVIVIVIVIITVTVLAIHDRVAERSYRLLAKGCRGPDCIWW